MRVAGRRPRPSRVRAPRSCSSPTRPRRPSRAPVPALLAVGTVHHAALQARAALAGLDRSSRATSHGSRTTSRVCSATAPTRSARASRSRRSPRWPPRTRLGRRPPVARRGAEPLQGRDRGRRAQDHGQDGDLGRRVLSRRPDLRGDRPGARRRRALLPGDALSRSGGIGFAELERETRRPPRRGPLGLRRMLENPGYVKFRKGGEPHATTPAVVAALHETAAAHALRKAVNGGGWRPYERFAALVNGRAPLELRDLLEPAPRGRRCRSRRSSRPSRSCGASPAGRCPTARSRPRRTRRSRSR